MYTEKDKSGKIFKSEEVILKPCHVVLVKLDTKHLSASYIGNLESYFPHLVAEVLKKNCSEQETNPCSDTLKLNKSCNINPEKQTKVSEMQSNKSDSEQVLLDDLNYFQNERSQSSTSSANSIESSHSVKVTKFNKNDKQSNFEKICTPKKNNNFGEGFKDTNSNYLSSEEICSQKPTDKSNHSNILTSNEYFTENLRNISKKYSLKPCSVVITKLNKKHLGAKNALTSTISYVDEVHKKFKRKYSVDSPSIKDSSDMSHTDLRTSDDNYSIATTLELDCSIHEQDVESNVSSSSFAELRRSCNIDNFSDTDIDEKTEKNINHPLTYFAHKFKHDISVSSGSESNFSDFIKNCNNEKRKNYELPLKDFISDAKCNRRKNSDIFVKRKRSRSKPLDNASKHSNRICKAEIMKRRHSDSETSSNILVLNLSDSETASNYSDTIPYGYKNLRKNCFHSEISLNSTDSGNDSNSVCKSKSKRHEIKPTEEAKTTKQSRRKHSDSETSLNCSDSNVKCRKCLRKRRVKYETVSDYSDLAFKAKRSRRKHADSETPSNILVLNYSDSGTNSNYSDAVKCSKFKTSMKYSDLKVGKSRRRKPLNSESSADCSVSIPFAKKSVRRKHLDSETSLNSDSEIASKYCNSTTIPFANKSVRRKHLDSETSLNSDSEIASKYCNSTTIPFAKKSVRRKHLDSETSLNSDSEIASKYCNSTTIPFVKKSVRRKHLDSETSLNSDSEIASKYSKSTTKSKSDRGKKLLRSKTSTYTSSIENSGGKVKKTLGLRTASHPVSKRNRHNKFLDSETSSNCSDSISTHKRSKQQKLLSSETSSESSDSISQFKKTKAKHLETEISHNLSDFETDSNFSVSTVRISHADKLSPCMPCKVFLIKLNPSETNIMIHDKKFDRDCETSKDEKNEPEMAGRYVFAKNTDLQKDSSTTDILESVISQESFEESINTLEWKETDEKSASNLSNGSACEHCVQCHTKFSNLRASYDHICPGKQEKGYICQYCEKIFPTCISLRIHGKIHKSVIVS